MRATRRRALQCLCGLLAAPPWRAAPAAAPGWLDGRGRPGAIVHEAMALLAAAADEGLDPADYAVPPPAPADAAWAMRLEDALRRFLRDLQGGRVSPASLGFRVLARPMPAATLAEALHEALGRGGLAPLVARLRPSMPQYGALREALARYRALAADVTLPTVPPTGPTVHPGEPLPEAQRLQRRLAAFGDLPADLPAPGAGARLDGPLLDGLRRFQQRHGLDVDGVIGRSTRAALAVTPAQRVRQIGWAMERLRWLPAPAAPRPVIAVNLATFRLWAWDAGGQEREPVLSMKVIVGRAMRTRTPVFADEMRYLVFRPSWQVPRSIVRDEILPTVARDPRYLARHDMELTQRPGETLPRVRQRPGPANALGLVKFIFPNDDAVYLHDTPAPQLFERSRRDFSHGCVRLERPAELASWLLRDVPGWSSAAVRAAMDGGDTRQVDLPAPVPVLLYYLTASIAPDDGLLHFADDVYGHDAALARALAAQPRG